MNKKVYTAIGILVIIVVLYFLASFILNSPRNVSGGGIGKYYINQSQAETILGTNCNWSGQNYTDQASSAGGTYFYGNFTNEWAAYKQ